MTDTTNTKPDPATPEGAGYWVCASCGERAQRIGNEIFPAVGAIMHKPTCPYAALNKPATVQPEPQSQRSPIVVNLDQHIVACHICGAATPIWFGVPVYEGEIVPVDWPGAWSAATVCERCYREYERGEHIELRWDDLQTRARGCVCCWLRPCLTSRKAPTVARRRRNGNHG